MTTTNVTPAQASAGLINTIGAKWAGNITFSIPGDGAAWASGYGRNEPLYEQYGVLSTTQADNFRAAIELWDSYIAPSLDEVSDVTPGDIRVAFTDMTAIENNPNVAAFAYGPSVGGASPVAGDVWIDESLKSDPFDRKTPGFELLVHELGHSLGLKHPFEPPTLPAGYDFKTYSIMSYATEDYFYTFSGGGGSIFLSTEATIAYTPMVLDILAIQNHYGADLTTARQNNTYQFQMTDLNGRQALYDAAGADTIDVSQLTRGSRIDLRPGAYSDLAYYAVEDQIDDLIAQYGEGFRSFITNQLTNPNHPAYEWERNLGVSFSTIVENAIGSSLADEIIGNDVSNRLLGGGGADTLFGLLGDDVLAGGAGGDLMYGAAGLDTADYSGSSGVRVSLDGVYSGTGDAAGDAFSQVENLVGSLAGADTLRGNAGKNTLNGLRGNDRLEGGDGDDLLIGGAGADGLLGGAGVDMVDYSASTGVRASLDGAIAGTGDAAGDAFSQVEGLTGSTAGNDTLRGNAVNNTLFGQGGNDRLEGGSGNDVLVGGAGADQLSGGSGLDIADYSSSSGVRVSLDGAHVGTGDAAGDTFAQVEWLTGSATGADTLRGNTANNTLNGRGGADRLEAGAGNDWLVGGAGMDTMFGDAGQDSFVFLTAASAASSDTILDYVAVDDTMRLEDSVFLGLTKSGNFLAAQCFGSGSAATTAQQRILYDAPSGALRYDVDGVGGQAAIHFATITSIAGTLSNQDFIII